MDGLRIGFGSPSWARTSDLRINSPSLYRLSYRGSAKKRDYEGFFRKAQAPLKIIQHLVFHSKQARLCIAAPPEMKMQPALARRLHLKLVPARGVEPPTFALRMRCSTN